MKKSYDFFCSSTMAYCISMLFAVSLGSISKPLTVQKYTVACCSFSTDGTEGFGYDHISCSGKKNVTNKSADLDGQNFKNDYPNAGSQFFHRNFSFSTSYKLSTTFRYTESLNDVMVIQHQKSRLPSVENSKDLSGLIISLKFRINYPNSTPSSL